MVKLGSHESCAEGSAEIRKFLQNVAKHFLVGGKEGSRCAHTAVGADGSSVHRTLPGKRFTLQPQAGNSPFCYQLNSGFAKYPFLVYLWKKKTTGNSLFVLFRRLIIPSGLKNDSVSNWKVLFLQPKNCNGGDTADQLSTEGKIEQGNCQAWFGMMLEGEKIFGSCSELGPIQLALACTGHMGWGVGTLSCRAWGWGAGTYHKEVEMSWLGDLGAIRDVALLENGTNSRLTQDRLCRPVRGL